MVVTAAELFYEVGVTATGVDAVVARSGVSKPTLYRHFGSKPALVAAVLADAHERRQRALVDYLEAHPASPQERPLVVFDWLGAWHASEGHRGCAFLNAAAELPGAGEPARGVIAAHKGWLRGYLAELCAQAGVDDPDGLAYALLLLVDGANARVLVDGDLTAATRARGAAERLLAAHGSPAACASGRRRP